MECQFPKIFVKSNNSSLFLLGSREYFCISYTRLDFSDPDNIMTFIAQCFHCI